MRGNNVLTVALLSLLALAVGASAQSQPPQPPAKPAAQEKAKPPAKKAKKVWTEDDIQSVRKPSDEYVEQREKAAEAGKAAEAAKAAEAEAKAKEPEEQESPEGKARNSPEALEKLVGELQDKIAHTEELIETARRNMTSATDEDRYNSYKLEMETHQENLVYLQKRAEEKRGQLEEAKKKAAKSGEKPATPPAPEKP